MAVGDLVPWSDSLKLGIKKIDDQHHKLVNILNDVNRAFYNKEDKCAYQDALLQLLDYTKEHFKEEEKYFQLYKYEFFDVHKSKHESFIAEIKNFSLTLDKSVSLTSVKMLNFLKSWITEHILVEDKKYVPLFKQKGII